MGSNAKYSGSSGSCRSHSSHFTSPTVSLPQEADLATAATSAYLIGLE